MVMKEVGHMWAIVEDKTKGIVYELRDLGFNMLLNVGKAFILDHSLGINNWFNPGSSTTQWGDMVNRYFHVGIGTDAGGVTGPTESVPVATGGSWTGVSPDDWILDDWLAGKLCSTVSRADGQVYAKLYCTFGTAELGAGELDINEIGIGLAATQPAANPMYNTSQRPKVILIRKILYKISGGYYVVDPITRPAGADITLVHEFGVVDV